MSLSDSIAGRRLACSVMGVVLFLASAIPSPAEVRVVGKPPGAVRLKAERSPYLIAHADNLVDWYPWGETASGKPLCSLR